MSAIKSKVSSLNTILCKLSQDQIIIVAISKEILEKKIQDTVGIILLTISICLQSTS